MAENYNPYEETDEAHPETSAIAEDSVAESKGADDETTGDRVASELVDRAQKLAPKQVAEGLKQLKPYLLAAGKFARKCYPYVVRGYGLCNQGWHAMQPYHPEEFLPALGG